MSTLTPQKLGQSKLKPKSLPLMQTRNRTLNSHQPKTTLLYYKAVIYLVSLDTMTSKSVLLQIPSKVFKSP